MWSGYRFLVKMAFTSALGCSHWPRQDINTFDTSSVSNLFTKIRIASDWIEFICANNKDEMIFMCFHDSFQVIQISDSHLLPHEDDLLKGVTTWQTFRAVLERITHEHPRPDLIVATGDLVHDGPLAAYRRFRAHLDRLNIPVRVLPGNHDDPALLAEVFHVDTERDMASTADYIDFGHINQGNWLMVFLNTVIPETQHGTLDSRELTRLDALLSAQPDRHALLFMHHHPIPRKNESPNFPGLRGAKSFFSVVDRHPSVRGIVWGHIHNRFEENRRKVLLFGAPSTCFQFNTVSMKQLSPTDGPPAYRRLTLAPDGTIESDVVQVSI
uniref:Icc protein n=1 Tax=Candidatus Kentrum sp. MB TaxID=2138164 RepID=A0A450Y339_9GAMM|nr:MAG: Icc protein [Candidatus Kentron sp. MB]VFK77576.1 MAG: Icc protein [Candidatus Kentron sp. MB]